MAPTIQLPLFDTEPARRVCSVDGCDRWATSKGMCSFHYKRLVRNGDVGADKPARRRKLRDPADARDDAFEAGWLIDWRRFRGMAVPVPAVCRRCCSYEQIRLDSKVNRGTECVWCVGIRVEFTDVARILISAGMTPLEPYPGGHTPWRMRHKCGREVSPCWGKLRSGRPVCGYCSGKVVDPNEVERLLALREMEPLEPYPGSGVPWKVHHRRCGRLVVTTWNRLQQGGGGCRHCGGGGFDPSAEGWVYLVADETDSVRKVGISNFPERRLADHARQGLDVVVGLWGPMPGGRAQALEREALAEVRASGSEPVPEGARDWPHGGRSESWWTAEYPEIPAALNRLACSHHERPSVY